MWNVETYTKLHLRTAYGIFLSFSNTLKVNETPQKKFNFLLKIISATKKIPEVNVLVVLMENWVCLTLQQLAFFVFKSQSDYNHLTSKKSAFRCRYKHQSKVIIRASLVAQWLRVCLPMQGTRVRALVWEDPTCRGATRPVSHNY